MREEVVQRFFQKARKGKMKGIKGRTIFLTSKNERLRDVLMVGKQVDKTKERKDSSKEELIPMLILLAIILLGGILLAVRLIFSE
jgi:hypothetical protein